MSKIPPCDTCGAVERSGASWKDTRDSPSKALGTRGAVLDQSPNGDPAVGIKPGRHFVVRFGRRERLDARPPSKRGTSRGSSPRSATIWRGEDGFSGRPISGRA